jgi:hypothetical protein
MMTWQAVGSKWSIDNGASTRTLWRRVCYGGRKGRAARRRLAAIEKRIAPDVKAMLAHGIVTASALLEPVFRFAIGPSTSTISK